MLRPFGGSATKTLVGLGQPNTQGLADMNGLVHRPTVVPMQRRVGSANSCCYRAGGYRVGHRFAVRRRARPMALVWRHSDGQRKLVHSGPCVCGRWCRSPRSKREVGDAGMCRCDRIHIVVSTCSGVRPSGLIHRFVVRCRAGSSSVP